jgi:hypothetical protein
MAPKNGTFRSFAIGTATVAPAVPTLPTTASTRSRSMRRAMLPATGSAW